LYCVVVDNCAQELSSVQSLNRTWLVSDVIYSSVQLLFI